MKVNNIKALDYQHQGNTLVLTFAETSMEEIAGMDTALLTVKTDEGDMVEAFAGFRLVRVTYEAVEETFTAVLEQGTDDTTAKALAAMNEELKRLDTAQQVVNGPMIAAVCAFAAISTEIPDNTALEMVSLFPTWDDVLRAGEKLRKGRIIVQGSQPYRVEQDVTPQVHQPPDSEGMLAIYRPIDRLHAGTQDAPIPWVSGMDCRAGQFFSFNGAIYEVAAGGDMIPCTYPPDTPDMWQWVKIN